MKPKGLIIDLGKGNLDKQSVIYAKNRKIKILRCDITETLVNYVRENFYNHHFKLKKKDLLTVLTLYQVVFSEKKTV